MKNLEQFANELEIEIKNKKRDLAILKTDQIMRNLTINDLAEFTNINAVTKYYYLNVHPRVPLREKNTSKIMCRCLGNVEKLTEKKILARKTEAIANFKQRWIEMRKDFEILKDFS
jgi:hypothetical protein